ncbi:aminoglycoside phosphotransferase (APT) family kinase protein [Paenibacillus sp. V4I9]|uniref:aminoglycoside phosphotransferase family protein n=1 Tax=Paenibacillus sp. V4I9 TaxID=3042308 RepID=UPI00277E8C0D|nr:phosphotransferase [Paenibacillus sp. V4I9]MDQ0888918.1 aminoglycoside phosphotransferase (APT) family kinase protein [Paenibacillus sp. V4I9]
MNLSDIKKHIPSMTNISEISLVSKGFSYDGKYFLYEESDLPKYVLRTSPRQQIQHKRQEFEVVTNIYEMGVRTSKPIEFGSIESLDICYMILSFVEGDDASEILPSLSYDEQYQIGIEAGQELRKMHELTKPSSESWYERRLLKHNHQYESYRNCGVKLPEEDIIISFINQNLIYINNRPNRFQHDDFHPSNLIIHDRSYVGVIDFNRCDWGDPYHDFLKIAYFSREVSIPFCIGQIHGYFNGIVPLEFWKLYALYTAMIIFPTITWTLKVVPEQLESMLARINVVLKDHQNFEKIIPVWFNT